MPKFYRVKKDTFMWLEGAILKQEGSGYVSISDVWDGVDLGGEYITAHIIENKDNAEWFERVYESPVSKAVYVTKEKARQIHNKIFKEKN